MEDSGQFPLTRDKGQLLIKEALDEFETDVVGEIKTKIDRLTTIMERATGAAMAVGVILGLPELVWVLMQMFGKGH